MSDNDASMLERWPQAVGRQSWLDPFATKMDELSRSLFRSSRFDAIMSGSWLGHTLHPALTDLPIGFWTSAMVVDFWGGRAGAPTAKRLIGWGNVSALPTAVAGLADARARTGNGRRVAAAHAALNVCGLALYGVSWLSRRGTRRGLAIASSIAGATLLTASGHLGGHMAFASEQPDESDQPDAAPERSGS